MTDLPTRRDEAWRWADLRAAERMAGAGAQTPAPANDLLPETAYHWLDVPGERRLFIAGHPVDAPISTPEPDRTLPKHPLADLAAGTAIAGTTLSIEGDGGTVQLLHLGTGASAHGVTRVTLAAGARLTIIETFADDGSDHWLNHRFDADVGEGASLTRIVRIRTTHGLASERAAVTLAANARFAQLAVCTADGSTRTEVHVRHDGPGAEAHVNGILLGDGAAALDALTRLEHRVPHTSSTQVWRLVAAGQSQVSVAGGVNVARHAQQTDAEQSLKALVLKRTAAAHLKPELEIFADDVKCAHGCTVGELDKAALFYLASRGIPPAQAESLLTRAFVADALLIIEDEALREALDSETRQWLESRT